jgi:asparagine synthase (glutamine-hydrolysing)
VPSPATAFKNIYKLPAGHALLCGADGSLNVYRYWAPPSAEKQPLARHPVELRTELRALLENSVRKRLLADVPIGALLSGGIDSGLVVALMSQLSDKPVKTFTVGFGDPKRDELDEARLVAERYGTDHTEVMVKPTVSDLLPDLVRHYNEPFADSSAVPSYYVSKAARSEVTVALCGDGGDESFSGYHRYGEVQAWKEIDRLPSVLRKAVADIGRAVINLAPHTNFAARADRGLAMVSGNLPERYELTMALLKPQEKRDWYSRAFQAEITRPGPVGDNEWNAEMDVLNWMSRHDQQNYLPDCLMVKMDVASMANSLEVRAPLLDYEVVEFAAGIPGNLKRQGALGKLLLRDLAASLLPQKIIQRRKTGFDIPVAEWLRTDLRDLLAGYLLDDVSQRRGLFDQTAIARIVSQHNEGKRDWSNRLWALLMLEIWFREFMD